MVDYWSYMGLILNSIIRCIETTLNLIMNIPIFNLSLGAILYSLIFIGFALNIFSKWIYKKRNIKEEGDDK